MLVILLFNSFFSKRYSAKDNGIEIPSALKPQN